VNYRKLKLRVLRWIPRKRHLDGGFVHKILGDRLFHPHIWKLSASSFGNGLTLGTFIAFTPTMGLQMPIAAVCAYFLKVNLPSALLACWITNPVTAGIIYPLEYQLGHWVHSIIGWVDIGDGVSQKFQISWRNTAALISGSFIFSIVSSFLVYVLYGFLFRWLQVHKPSGARTFRLYKKGKKRS